MIMDRISDWITTAWELLGLVFLAMSADLLMKRRWEADDAGGEPKDDVDPRTRPAAPHTLGQPHFA